MEWMLLPYKRLYSVIEGRSSRREYWMFALLNVLIFAVYAVLFFAFGGIAMLNPKSIASAMAGAGIVMLLLLLLPLYLWAIITGPAAVALTIRRFHDLNLSGWLYAGFLVASFIPFLNLLSWLVLLIMMCVGGTSGPNRYGDDPTREATSANVFS